MILVAGSTNELGCEICYILASRGKSIRALVLNTSDPAWVERLKNFGATLAVGDPHDPIFLADACVGVNEVICSPIAPPPLQQGETHFSIVDQVGVMNLIDAAKAADILRFVYISFSIDANLRFASRKEKQQIEQRLIESGMPYTILHTGDRRSQAQPVSRIFTRELARLATQALEDPARRNAVVEPGEPAVPGPEYKRPLEVVTGRRIRW